MIPLLALLAAAQPAPAAPPPELAPAFRPPAALAADLGPYRSPLTFDDGTTVRTPADWQKRRQEILKYWHGVMGPWPALLKNPKVEVVGTEKQVGYARHRVRVEVAAGRMQDDAYLLVPDGKGPFPAVLVVFYDAKTAVGLGKATMRDFGLRLVKKGFVVLSVGGPGGSYDPKAKGQIQPLSYHAYVAANCCTALARRPDVDPARVGVVGHSYGGKWAMFASCLHDGFACGVWSDGGVVFDEKRGNVNYWEPWYLGFDGTLAGQRKPGIPADANPRTGAYKKLVADGRDLHELHALMAPRPFLVSGGSEDPPERWKALNHAVAVNKLLGADNRVAMTNRKTHDPTAESNDQIDRFFELVLQPRK